MKLNKKAVSPVVAVMLLVAVAVTSVSSYAIWARSYQAQIQDSVQDSGGLVDSIKHSLCISECEARFDSPGKEGCIAECYNEEYTSSNGAEEGENGEENGDIGEGEFLVYEVGKHYVIGDVVIYKGLLYEVIQSHTSQDDWKPDQVPALFKQIPFPGEIPEWRQPHGAHDAYTIGDKVLYEGKLYESLRDGNVWSPSVVPDYWELIG